MRKVRGIALVTLFAFGCGTVRVPAAGPPPPPQELGPGVAEPAVELWVEGTKSVDPAEAAQAAAAARDALAGAVAGRGAVAAQEGAVLEATERAVVRTSSRRSDQVLAIVGMVVGIVVVVVVVVVVLVAGRGRDLTPPSGAKAVKAAPAAAGAAAVRGGAAGSGRALAGAFPGRVRPAPPALRPSGTGRVQPAPPRGWAPLPPLAWVPAPLPPPLFGLGFDLGYAAGFPAPPPYALPPEEAPEEEPPPPPPFDLGERGFFSGEETQLELVVKDVETGRRLWARYVRKDVDPRDERRVAALVEEMLRDQEWAQRALPGPERGTEGR